MAKKDPPKAAKGGDAPAEAAPAKRSMLLPLILCIVGIAIGGGGAAGYFLFMHKPAAPAAEAETAAKEKASATELVAIERITIPLINAEGKLVRYASLDLQLEVATEDRTEADLNVALARAGVTRRMSQESVVTLADSGIIDYDRADAILTEAVNAGYGKPLAKKVHITSIVPM